MDWIQLVQVAVKWWPLVNTIMNLKAAYNASKALTRGVLTEYCLLLDLTVECHHSSIVTDDAVLSPVMAKYSLSYN